jgi:hypothetical protein
MSPKYIGSGEPPAWFTTFREWLSQQTGREDRVGDLARDADRDPCFPPALSMVKRYLMQGNACPGALKALEQAREEYNHR